MATVFVAAASYVSSGDAAPLTEGRSTPTTTAPAAEDRVRFEGAFDDAGPLHGTLVGDSAVWVDRTGSFTVEGSALAAAAAPAGATFDAGGVDAELSVSVEVSSSADAGGVAVNVTEDGSAFVAGVLTGDRTAQLLFVDSGTVEVLAEVDVPAAAGSVGVVASGFARGLIVDGEMYTARNLSGDQLQRLGSATRFGVYAAAGTPTFSDYQLR